MASLESDFVSPIEVLVEVVTCPSDGKQLILNLFISRLRASESTQSITDMLNALR